MSILDKKKRLDRLALYELRKRLELVNTTLLTAQALELQKNVWLRGKLQELGIKSDGDYNVDLKTGVIEETKKEEVKK